jgi:hypothetical protein
MQENCGAVSEIMALGMTERFLMFVYIAAWAKM